MTAGTTQPAALDELAWLVADAVEGGTGLDRAAEVVATLERLAGTELGPVAGEPGVVLARRFARAARSLADRPERLAGLGAERDADVRTLPARTAAVPGRRTAA
ncbi:hypothetical protein GCU56_00805 [Geodermatophilus sabuli]|uniref:Uncharacterized protein n=1 Tax=Geodermatophilus sabuli TaxID=1564158 RepID=A0A7K3VWF4_9ACTN|nr:hypothetical protein [Geodermatophilus sabuli]NEK56413.1 hypothetical protein [Geodermatophilus sabuli]